MSMIRCLIYAIIPDKQCCVGMCLHAAGYYGMAELLPNIISKWAGMFSRLFLCIVISISWLSRNRGLGTKKVHIVNLYNGIST